MWSAYELPDGVAWVLMDDAEVIVLAALEGGGVGLMAFTEEALATKYARDKGLVGRKAKAFGPGQSLVDFLRWIERKGVTKMLVDAEVDTPTVTTSIRRVIEDVEKRMGKAPNNSP